jgi:S-methylmethionine-dependent homocysteine/selenocysteine methylase
MTVLKSHLPGQNNKVYLTDGGLETTLIFHEGYDLPYFAAFDLLRHEKGCESLIRYFEKYAVLAVRNRSGFVLESPTWRASKDWAMKLGYSDEELVEANQKAIQLLQQIRDAFALPDCPFVISGCIGPRGDGYVIDKRMTPKQSQDYHLQQINTFKQSDVDLVTAVTMTYPEEAIGIVNAAKAHGLPVVISFTTETDGKLPNGMTLKEAIELVDAATANGPLYYMINCAHPDHFNQALENGDDWVKRIKGVRANASRKSHAELDEADELDAGDPQELANQYQALRKQFPHFKVLGGCCGTDHRHVEEIGNCCCGVAAH